MAIPDPLEHPTLTVEEAGRICGLGRSAAYEAARRGELPTLAFGRRRVVPTAALRRLLAIDSGEEGAAVR
jgi:excisionase family DNA binding protein